MSKKFLISSIGLEQVGRYFLNVATKNVDHHLAVALDFRKL